MYYPEMPEFPETIIAHWCALRAMHQPIETARFLTLPRQERLDSVMRHRRWQDGLQKEALLDLLFGAQSPPA